MQHPESPPQLYEFEGCPFCAQARKSLSTLAVDVLIKPCPKGGTRFRPEAEQLGGKAQFPFLVDLNTSTRLYEADAIIDHLQREYGTDQPPQKYGVGLTDLVGAGLASLVSGVRGPRAHNTDAAEHPLEVYAIDAFPDARALRGLLCELELPYVRRSVSQAGEAAVERAELVQPPCLKDPNTDTVVHDPHEIMTYLKQTYGA